MRYEWGEIKDKINRNKHGMSLSAGIYVFDDPYRIEAYDGCEGDEDRFITIGMDAATRILYVCYTMRPGDNSTRLISVRKTEQHENRLYDKQRQW